MNDEKFHIVMAERAERAKRKTDDIHARELAAMRLRAERAEAIVALAMAVERASEERDDLQGECRSHGWQGPNMVLLYDAKIAHSRAVEALQTALAKAGEA